MSLNPLLLFIETVLFRNDTASWQSQRFRHNFSFIDTSFIIKSEPRLKAIYLPSLPIPTVKPQVDLQVDCRSEVLSSIDGLVAQLLLDSENLQITVSRQLLRIEKV